jgi:hypothetical protein
MVGKCLREVVDLALKFTKTNLHSSLYRILMSQGAVVCKMWVFCFCFPVIIEQGADVLGGQNGGSCGEVPWTNSWNMLPGLSCQ